MTIDEKPVPDAGLRRLIRANVLTVVFEVVVPMALFYGLRAAGVGQWWALMAGVLVAAPYVVWTVVHNRRIDLGALVTLSVLVLSVVLGLLSDDPRTLAIREGWTAAVGGLVGAWMLVTVVIGRPAQLTLGRTIAEVKRGAEGAAAWAARWETDARFRRGLRIDTAVWGCRAAGQRGGARRARLHTADRPHLPGHHHGVARRAGLPDRLARLVHPQGEPRCLTSSWRAPARPA
jgi:hypothetical protein